MCLKMWFSTSVDIKWNGEAAIYTKNLLSSHSIVSKWSLVNDTGRVKLTQLNGVNNAIMQVTLIEWPRFNLLFYCHIILYWEKMTSYEKFSHNITLEVQIFQTFNVSMLLMKVLKYWKIVEFRKTSIKMKNWKTFYKT